MNRLQMVQDVKDLLAEGGIPYENRDRLIVRSIERGMERVCQQCKFPELERWKTYPVVQYQQDYVLPSDYIGEIEVLHDWKRILTNLSASELFGRSGSSANLSSDPPSVYGFNVKEGTRNLRIFPAPSVAADTTTLNGALSAGATTITITDSSSFPERGRVTIESEVIEYTFNDTTLNQLKNCTRGIEDTSDVLHADTTSIFNNDLQLRYFSYNPALTADTSTPLFPNAWHECLVFYAAWKASLSSRDKEFSTNMRVEFEVLLREAEGQTNRSRLGRMGRWQRWRDISGSVV